MNDETDDVCSMRWYTLDAEECREYVLVMIAFGCIGEAGDWPYDAEWMRTDTFNIGERIEEMKRIGLLSSDRESRLPEQYKKTVSDDQDFWNDHSIEQG